MLTQADIDNLIKNAKQEDSTAGNTPAEVTLKFATGVFTASDATSVTSIATVAGQKATGSTAIVADASGKFVGANTVTITSNKYGQDYNIDIEFIFKADEGKESVTLNTAPSYNMSTATDLSGAVGTYAGYQISLMSGKEYTAEDIEDLLAEAGLNVSVELSGVTANNGTDEPNTLFITDSTATNIVKLQGCVPS